MLIRSISVLAVGVVLAACVSTTKPTTRRIYNAKEAAFIAGETHAPPLNDAAPYWTPNPVQIRDLEHALLNFMLSNWPADRSTVGNLSEYVRQYFGVTRGSAQRILVNTACKSYAEQNSNWGETFIMALDGGSCFFQVEFDPISGNFDAFNVNGEG